MQIPTTTKSILRHNSPLFQVILIGFVCFFCPGMFNALAGIGGVGQVDPTASNNSLTALYATFAVFGVLGGGISNILGLRIALFSSCLTYVLFVGSFLYYNHIQKQSFPIVAGALLGVGAGILWAAQGAIVTSYPPPDRKGTYISIFWCLFNLGGVIGSLIPFLVNFHRTKAASVNDATYIGFMFFMSVGTLLSLAILPPGKVVRDDGTLCADMINHSTVSTEAVEIVKLFMNWKMLLIVPVAWSSTFFYTYQFNNVNGVLFNLRTRGFNNMFYWGAEMFGSVGIGYLMDFSFKSRRARGFFGIAVVGLLGTGIWGGGFANQLGYSRSDLPAEKLDFAGSGVGFAGPFLLYFSFGLLDAMFQSMVYWILGCLATDSQTLGRYAGFYKGVQSAGAAVAWQVDTHRVSFMSQLLVNWSLITVSYPLLVVLVMLAVKDDNISEEGTAKEEAALPSSNPDSVN